jgi:hypothetical protein
MKVLKGAVSALFVGALFLAAPLLRADDKDGHKHWDKFDHLKKELSLSDGQVSQWKDAEKGQKEDGKLLRDKIKADMANLAVLVDQKASDEALSAALKSLEADHKAQADLKEKMIQTLKGILKPMQQAKLVVSMGEHKGPAGRWGGMDGGPMGGPGAWNHEGGPDHGPDGGPEGGPEGK